MPVSPNRLVLLIPSPTDTLQSQGKAPLGWMAMSVFCTQVSHAAALTYFYRGFGTQMANTPMVIMWNNSDGSITLSQRMASAEVMPTVVSNPPRNATTDMSAVSLTGSKPQFAFTIPVRILPRLSCPRGGTG